MAEKIKKQLRIFLPYGAVMAVLFFAVPFIYLFLEETSLVPLVILATVNPVVLVVLAIIYVIKNGFTVHYHLLQSALFLLSVLLHYGYGTAPYALIYAIFTVVFSFLLQMFKKQ